MKFGVSETSRPSDRSRISETVGGKANIKLRDPNLLFGYFVFPKMKEIEPRWHHPVPGSANAVGCDRADETKNLVEEGTGGA